MRKILDNFYIYVFAMILAWFVFTVPPKKQVNTNVSQNVVDSIIRHNDSIIDSLENHRDSVVIVKIKQIEKIKYVPIKTLVEEQRKDSTEPKISYNEGDSLVCIDTLSYRMSLLSCEDRELKLFESNSNNEICQQELKTCRDTSTVRISAMKTEAEDQQKIANKQIVKRNILIGVLSTVILGLTLSTAF